MRRSVLVAVVAVGAAGASGASAQETATPDYRSMFLKASKQSVQATLGAFCHANDSSPENCSVTPKYPLKTTGTLKLKPGTKVTLLFKADAGEIGWRAARIDGKGNEVITAVGQAKLITKKTKRRWQITLPDKLARSSDLLGFDVTYPNSYSSFEVGLQVLKK